MRVPLFVCVRVYALRIVSRNKILHFKNTFIIIIIYGVNAEGYVNVVVVKMFVQHSEFNSY